MTLAKEKEYAASTRAPKPTPRPTPRPTASKPTPTASKPTATSSASKPQSVASKMMAQRDSRDSERARKEKLLASQGGGSSGISGIRQQKQQQITAPPPIGRSSTVASPLDSATLAKQRENDARALAQMGIGQIPGALNLDVAQFMPPVGMEGSPELIRKQLVQDSLMDPSVVDEAMMFGYPMLPEFAADRSTPIMANQAEVDAAMMNGFDMGPPQFAAPYMGGKEMQSGPARMTKEGDPFAQPPMPDGAIIFDKDGNLVEPFTGGFPADYRPIQPQPFDGTLSYGDMRYGGPAPSHRQALDFGNLQSVQLPPLRGSENPGPTGGFDIPIGVGGFGTPALSFDQPATPAPPVEAPTPSPQTNFAADIDGRPIDSLSPGLGAIDMTRPPSTDFNRAADSVLLDRGNFAPSPRTVAGSLATPATAYVPTMSGAPAPAPIAETPSRGNGDYIQDGRLTEFAASQLRDARPGDIASPSDYNTLEVLPSVSDIYAFGGPTRAPIPPDTPAPAPAPVAAEMPYSPDLAPTTPAEDVPDTTLGLGVLEGLRRAGSALGGIGEQFGEFISNFGRGNEYNPMTTDAQGRPSYQPRRPSRDRGGRDDDAPSTDIPSEAPPWWPPGMPWPPVPPQATPTPTPAPSPYGAPLPSAGGGVTPYYQSYGDLNQAAGLMRMRGGGMVRPSMTNAFTPGSYYATYNPFKRGVGGM